MLQDWHLQVSRGRELSVLVNHVLYKHAPPPPPLSIGAIHKKMLFQIPFRSQMRRQTGYHEVAGSTPAEVGNILSWRLIVKYCLRSFSPFRWFKKGNYQFLAKECAQ